MAEKKIVNKNRKNFNKKKVQDKNTNRYLFKPTDAIGPFYEYQMSKESAKAILSDRKGVDAKKDARQYLCEYVTDQYGLMGTCVKVNTV